MFSACMQPQSEWTRLHSLLLAHIFWGEEESWSRGSFYHLTFSYGQKCFLPAISLRHLSERGTMGTAWVAFSLNTSVIHSCLYDSYQRASILIMSPQGYQPLFPVSWYLSSTVWPYRKLRVTITMLGQFEFVKFPPSQWREYLWNPGMGICAPAVNSHMVPAYGIVGTMGT